MNANHSATAAVLAACALFAAVSGAGPAVYESGERYPASIQKRMQLVRSPALASTRPAEAASRPASRPAPAATQPGVDSKVVVYYFHRTLRCPTCHLIEQLARQSLDEVFPGELAAGTLEWRVVNFEAGGNEHFEKDYRLETQSIVLVRMAGGKQAEWKNLDKLWDVIGEPAEFMKYFQDAARDFLYGPPSAGSK